MKLVNEKGKLFGIINPVDLIVLLAIVAVIGFFAVKTLKEPVTAVVSEKPDMYVTLRVRGALHTFVDQIKTLEPGTRLVAGNNFVSGATFESVTVEPYLYTSENADGVSVACNDPLKNDLLIVVKGTGSPNDPILKIGNQEVRTGSGYIFKTNTFEINTTVESVRFDG